MAYQGYLIKVGNYTIPHKLIQAEKYKSTHLVQDLDSYRDNDGYLHRTALGHVPDKVEFQTVPIMTEREMRDLLDNIRANYTVPAERKANVTMYVHETGEYVTQEMYMPDIPFELYGTYNETIEYNSIRLAFIGY